MFGRRTHPKTQRQGPEFKMRKCGLIADIILGNGHKLTFIEEKDGINKIRDAQANGLLTSVEAMYLVSCITESAIPNVDSLLGGESEDIPTCESESISLTTLLFEGFRRRSPITA